MAAAVLDCNEGLLSLCLTEGADALAEKLGPDSSPGPALRAVFSTAKVLLQAGASLLAPLHGPIVRRAKTDEAGVKSILHGLVEARCSCPQRLFVCICTCGPPALVGTRG